MSVVFNGKSYGKCRFLPRKFKSLFNLSSVCCFKHEKIPNPASSVFVAVNITVCPVI